MTTKKTIDQEALNTLVENSALRELRVVQEGPSGALEERIGTVWLHCAHQERRETLMELSGCRRAGLHGGGVKQLLIEL